MSERANTPSEASYEGSHGLMSRVRQAVGLSPKEHKLDIQEHETDVSPRTEWAEESHYGTQDKNIADATKASPEGFRSLEHTHATIEAPPPSHTPLNTQRFDQQGMEKPIAGFSSSTPTPTPTPTSSSDWRGKETTNEFPIIYGNKEQQVGDFSGVVSAPLHGDRVKVARVGGGFKIVGGQQPSSSSSPPVSSTTMKTATATAPISTPSPLKEVYVRPDHEVTPLQPSEVAEMKAKEHIIIAKEAREKADEKRKELIELRRQAEVLEKQSTQLFIEAEEQRRKVDYAHEKIEEIKHGEESSYAEAERAEAERRAIIQRAKPVVMTAEAAEHQAIVKKQQAADAEFHAQVLENRARSLLRESEEMARLSLDFSFKAADANCQLMVVRQEVQELRSQIDTQAARGLPHYIQDCEREIGALSHRIAQLKEEISWAQGEVERGRAEAETWNRAAIAKEGQAARLILERNNLNDSAEQARIRSKQAAEEARVPTELAGKKYEEAWQAAEEARVARAQAIEAQEQALETVKEAIGPAQERQRALREAAAAEAAAVQLETKAEVAAGKVHRQLYEAQVKSETAAAKIERAEKVEKEVSSHMQVKEAEEAIADKYTAQKEGHRPIEVPAV